ncbi:hypothetical protein [Caballeronia sp. dw_276]|uniref:hypothetical protein n=1 Tax=Caballeronia sp. dw_276 TaxID=2719795 RepID=UPI001BD39886|nr:hypothetical protein [Caballeronia sp. dw_276]
MAALPLSALQQREQKHGHTALIPRTAGQLKAEHDRIVGRAKFFLYATIALAIAGMIAVVAMPFSPIPDDFSFGAQEVVAVAVFAACLFLLHERAELMLRLYNFEPVEQTTQGEMRALLHRVPEGASYQSALAAENRTFVTVEVEEIRRRADAFKPTPEGQQTQEA